MIVKIKKLIRGVWSKIKDNNKGQVGMETYDGVEVKGHVTIDIPPIIQMHPGSSLIVEDGVSLVVSSPQTNHSGILHPCT